MEISDRHLATTALSRERTQVPFEYEAVLAPATGVTLRRRIECFFFPLAGIEPQTVNSILYSLH